MVWYGTSLPNNSTKVGHCLATSLVANLGRQDAQVQVLLEGLAVILSASNDNLVFHVLVNEWSEGIVGDLKYGWRTNDNDLLVLGLDTLSLMV